MLEIFTFFQPLLGLAWFSANLMLYNLKFPKNIIRPQPGAQNPQKSLLKEYVHNKLLICGIILHLILALHLIGADEFGHDVTAGLGLSNYLNSWRPYIYPDAILFLLEEKFSIVLGAMMGYLLVAKKMKPEQLFFVALILFIYIFVFRDQISIFNKPSTNLGEHQEYDMKTKINNPEPKPTDFYKNSEGNNYGDAKDKNYEPDASLYTQEEVKEEKKLTGWEILFEIIAFLFEVLA